MLEFQNQVKEDQIPQVKELRKVCKQHDGNVPNIYWHIIKKERHFPVNLLHYDHGQLVGFLSVFFFYKDACEICVMVHPDFRKRGLARQMLASAIPVIQAQMMEHLIFTAPRQLNDEWLKQEGYTYQHSEYHMQRRSTQPILTTNPKLHFREATLDDIQSLCALDEACFPRGQADMANRITHILEDRNYTVIVLLENNTLIGKTHIHWHETKATFTDIAVFPNLQGKGLGTALLGHCINLALTEGKSRIDLDVETSNQNALNLYLRQGFTIENAVDYWKISINRFI